MAAQLAEKIDDERGSDVLVGMQAKVQGNPVPAGTHAQGPQHRDFLVGSSPLQQDRGLTAGSPAAANQGGHQQAAFVHKNQKGLQSPGFFLMRGQSRLIQFLIFPSSRSTARR